jgi:hypothetical protein
MVCLRNISVDTLHKGDTEDDDDDDDDDNNNNNRLKCDQERSREIFKIYRSYDGNTAPVGRKNKSNTSNKGGNWNPQKITKKVSKKNTG